jgi:hypothetical protein
MTHKPSEPHVYISTRGDFSDCDFCHLPNYALRHAVAYCGAPHDWRKPPGGWLECDACGRQPSDPLHQPQSASFRPETDALVDALVDCVATLARVAAELAHGRHRTE